MKGTGMIAGLMMAIGLLTTNAALAQEPVQEQDLALEEVIVTAEARQETLQEVPVSVTAFNEEAIREAGIENTQDFVNLTPNLTLDDSFTVGNTYVTIRGVTQINNADSPVAIVVDGVPQNNQKQFKQELFDIERIEVLRGPQGALYGRNAIGGAINIVTREPGNSFGGFAKAGVGDSNSREFSGALNLPMIEDTLFLRLSGNYAETDGRIKNLTLNEEVDFYESQDFRARLLWNANERVTADFRYAHTELDGGATFDSTVGPGADINTNTFVNPTSDILGTSNLKSDSITVKLDSEFDTGVLSYIYGWTDLEEDYFGDLDFLPIPLLDQAQDLDVEMESHELRFVSPGDRRFRWIAGGFYQTTDKSLSTVANLLSVSPPFAVLDALAVDDNTAWAAFVQAEYDITDTLELSGSLRYDRDQRDQTSSGASADFDAWQPKSTLTWKINEQSLMYATYAQGFRSGGFNSDTTLFRSEELTNYEIGSKNTLWDGRLILNAAAFWADSDNFQYFFVDLNRGGAQVIDNIDKVRIRGAEIEFQALLSEGFTLFGGIGLLDTEIRALARAPQFVGNRTPRSTDSTLNLGAQYNIDLGNDKELFLRADYERRGDKTWHIDNLEVMDPVDLYGARIGLRLRDWSFTLWGKNLGDEVYYAEFSDFAFTGLPTGMDVASLAQPRSYGLEVRYDF